MYGAVPPVADTVMSAVPPLHKIDVEEVDTDNAFGSVTVIVTVIEHPLASVTV